MRLPRWWLALTTPFDLDEAPMNDLDCALDLLLPHEGGWSDHPNDRGGKTKYGITIATYRAARRLMPELPEHLRDLTVPQARAIYERMFWRDALAHIVPWPVNYLQFDAAVQHGPVRAIRFLQEVTGAAVDGVPGPETRRKITAVRDWALPVRDLLFVRSVYYIRILRDPTQASFASGWANRIEDVGRVGRG